MWLFTTLPFQGEAKWSCRGYGWGNWGRGWEAGGWKFGTFAEHLGNSTSVMHTVVKITYSKLQ